MSQQLVPILWTGLEKNLSYDFTLSKRGSSISILGLLLGKGGKRLNITINVVHKAPDTKSEIILKGVLKGNSEVNFKGLVKINKGAKGTETWQAVHLLILSDQAKGTAIPSLEILENDVKAGHEITVGKISDMEMFYLQSRGLSKQQAKKLIVQGFLSEVYEKRQIYESKLS
ncbi:SufD family Fe-S cluster assembly protein [Candidatus Daviesbacteria bacterium]|nr:SufD family Fe-S cluster assembly protein [Candidatus Daviesbacteria bacterium]